MVRRRLNNTEVSDTIRHSGRTYWRGVSGSNSLKRCSTKVQQPYLTT